MLGAGPVKFKLLICFIMFVTFVSMLGFWGFGGLGIWGFGVNQGLGAVRMLCHVKVAIKAMKETRMTNKASKLNLINTFCRG